MDLEEATQPLVFGEELDLAWECWPLGPVGRLELDSAWAGREERQTVVAAVI